MAENKVSSLRSVSLAGWIRHFLHQPLPSPSTGSLPWKSGEASSGADLSGGIPPLVAKIRHRIRRTIRLGLTFISPFQGLEYFGVSNPGRCPGLSPCAPLGLQPTHLLTPNGNVTFTIVVHHLPAPTFPAPREPLTILICHLPAPKFSAPTGRHAIAQGNALGNAPKTFPKP